VEQKVTLLFYIMRQLFMRVCNLDNFPIVMGLDTRKVGTPSKNALEALVKQHRQTRVKCNDTLIFAESASYAIPVTWVTQTKDAAPHQKTMRSEAVNRRYWRLK
jgi:hypothetical protein